MPDFTNLDANLNAHQNLPENPNQAPYNYTSDQLKTAWDKPVNDIKTYLNDTLVPELEAGTGASKLGAIVGGLNSNIQAFVNYVESAGTGSIPPNDTITDGMLVADIKIGSLTNLNTTIKTNLVGAINELKGIIANDNTPTGIIRMWSGLISQIPAGNVFCDGTNGTPDLRSRFIMGATNQAAMNTIGGNNTTTLTTTQMPVHNHTALTGTESAPHNHTVQTIVEGGGGSLNLLLYTYGTTSYPYIYRDITMNNNTTTHTHAVTVADAGSGTAYDSRPNFYTLAFIMRV